MQDYLRSLAARAADRHQRKAKQNAETAEAQQRAVEEARSYVAGLRIAGINYAA